MHILLIPLQTRGGQHTIIGLALLQFVVEHGVGVGVGVGAGLPNKNFLFLGGENGLHSPSFKSQYSALVQSLFESHSVAYELFKLYPTPPQ